MDITHQHLQRILDAGLMIAPRDVRLNTNYPGKYMIVEANYRGDGHNSSISWSTKDGSNGPWCVVGNSLIELLGSATAYADSLDGTSGQDRESYSDTQDRDSYTVTED